MWRALILGLLLAGCTKAPDFETAGATAGALSGPGGSAALNGADIAKLGVMIEALPGRAVEVYSKPDYVLTWQIDGREHTASVFLEERLIYPGDHTAAWSERMRGDRSRGAELSDELVGVLAGIAP